MQAVQTDNSSMLVVLSIATNILLLIVGFFLKETLRELKELQREHSESIGHHETRISLLEQKTATA